uniref:Uncharacterized protein n=1 Tax=Drosophila melanogaster TaxID=7227 RepID=Q9W4N1_DROME|nr:uncharacterized protein Dmel_CG15375 [Drosophila melanogaster]AAF45916.2 uncharacterized protein Dmel_CG15375 [Drosophila melanogaster]|eukprot:NP_572149.2 uncharacterized protein Dmel_CG15375 [Drosophila melanogaster]
MEEQNVDETKTNPLSRKLKFSGICKLTDEELSHLYKLDELTDEELASVDLKRSSLIDDYRLLHEVSMMRQMENEAAKPPNPPEPPKPPNPPERPKARKLLHFVKVMSFEEEPGTIFTEEQLRLDSNYMELNSDIFRLESFYNYLDSMYVSGNSNRAIDLVMFGIHRLNINILMNIHKFHTPKKAHQLPVHYDCNKFQIKLCIPKGSQKFQAFEQQNLTVHTFRSFKIGGLKFQ